MVIILTAFMKIKWCLPCSIDTRVKCLRILPTYGTYPLCKYSRLRNVSKFRYGSYLKILAVLGNRPAYLQHLLYKTKDTCQVSDKYCYHVSRKIV